MSFLLFQGSTTDTKSPSTSEKKSILVGKRPGLGVSSMLSQFKNYSQSKKSPVLSQRSSVFCSPDDEDDEEDDDYSKFLGMRGNSRPMFFRVFPEQLMAQAFQCTFCMLQWYSCLVTGILS